MSVDWNAPRKGDPNSPHWWMRPIELKELMGLVKLAHGQPSGVASITWNRIEVALIELQERMEKDAGDVARSERGTIL